MFRFFTLLVCFFTLLGAASGELQRFIPASFSSCSEYTSCYAYISQIFSQAATSLVHMTWIVHVFSLVMVVLGISGMLLTSYWARGSRLSASLWSIILAMLVGAQGYLSLNSEGLLTAALEHVVHYLITVLILSIAYQAYLNSKTQWAKRHKREGRLLVSFAILLVGLQLVLGAWVAANNAGLACGGFPKCRGLWWPEADYQHIFNLFSPLSFNATIALHWIHRIYSVVVFSTLTGVMLVSTASRIRSVRWAGALVSFLLLAQVGTGIILVKLLLPAWAVILHGLIAMVMMLPLLAIRFYTRYQALEEAEQQASERPEDKLLIDEKEDSLPEVEISESESLYLRLKSQLSKTRAGLGTVLSAVSLGNRAIDKDLLEEIETSLLIADVGMEVTEGIIAKLEENVVKQELQDAGTLSLLLKQYLLELLEPVSQPLVIPEQQAPYVILVVGINGAGKTTTIGKLAQRLQQEGHSVMLAAGDTFRAAAVEQLQVWGERNEIHVVAQHTGADSASVIYDAVQSAQAKGIDVLIADTAGRLHTKANLMQELSKIKRIMAKLDESAPHEVLLVLDAGTGQNALSQAEHFNQSVELTGIALTKLDGTAKGGMIFALAKKIGVPIRFLGVGEGINDLQDFHAEQFIDALFMSEET